MKSQKIDSTENPNTRGTVTISFQTTTEHESFEMCLKNLRAKIESIRSLILDTDDAFMKFEVKDFQTIKQNNSNDFMHKASHKIEVTIPKDNTLIFSTIKSLKILDTNAKLEIGISRQSSPKLYNELLQNRSVRLKPAKREKAEIIL